MAEMTAEQFLVVAELLRSQEPVRTAVRMILVEGRGNQEAIQATGMKPNAVSNALRRYRNAHAKICVAYCRT